MIKGGFLAEPVRVYPGEPATKMVGQAVFSGINLVKSDMIFSTIYFSKRRDVDNVWWRRQGAEV